MKKIYSTIMMLAASQSVKHFVSRHFVSKKMKKLLLLIGILLTSTTYAAEVTEHDALQKAQQLMPGKYFMTRDTIIKKARRALWSNISQKGYYVFNIENNGGFVLIAADDRMPDVLGYSDRGFFDEDSVPCNLKAVIEWYEQLFVTLSKSEGVPSENTKRTIERTTISPLLSTTWYQDFPLNVFCPIVREDRCMTGCVATAMAQVVNYNRWPKDATSAIPSYTTYTEKITMPALEPKRFYWDNMTVKSMAQLNIYCGQSVEMNYGLDEAGAYGYKIPTALKEIFGYSEDMRHVEKSNYSDEDWDELIFNELTNSRPVIYMGANAKDAHAFVVDGYKNGLYHVNWGWGGFFDGYFLLTGMNPQGTSYNDNQSAIIGIQPPSGSVTPIHPLVKVNTTVHYGGKFSWRQDDGSFPVSQIAYSIFNATEDAVTFQIGCGLFHEGELIKVYSQQQMNLAANEGDWLNAEVVIGSDIADGNYYLLPVYKQNESDAWSTVLIDVGAMRSAEADNELSIHDNLLRWAFDYQYADISELVRENVATSEIDGVFYNLWKYEDKCFATVIQHSSGAYSGDLYIPDDVVYNGERYAVHDADRNAFNACPNLTSVSTSMYESPSITGCENLSTVTLREGVSVLIEKTLWGCPKVTELIFPKSLTWIYNSNPFAANEGLKTIRFKSDKQLTFVNTPRFDNILPALTDIYFYTIYPPNIEWLEEFNANPAVTIHIPQGSISAYKASVWKDWKFSDDVDLSTKNLVWGYCIDNSANGKIVRKCKVGQEKDCEFAIHIPKEMIEPYRNCRITSIQYYQGAESQDTPEYAFITTSGQSYLTKQAIDPSTDIGWKTVSLSEPYTITGDELYVGLGRRNMFAIYYQMAYTESDALWFRISDDNASWENVAALSVDYAHPTTIRFTIEGDAFPVDMTLSNIKKSVSTTSTAIEALVTNRNKDIVNSYEVHYIIDGLVEGSKLVSTSLGSGMFETVSLDIPSTLTNYHHQISLDITKVNGLSDEIPVNSTCKYDFSSAATHFPRRSVMETSVGTSYEGSPRSYATISRIRESYPDNFIPVCIHYDDEMSNSVNYDEEVNKIIGNNLPSCLINRLYYNEAGLDEVLPLVESLKDVADADITIEAMFTSDEETSVKVNSTTKYGFNDMNETGFHISYIVAEDKVGPYLQKNFYSNPTGDLSPGYYLNDWYLKDDEVMMYFDDVARSIHNAPESLATIVEAENDYNLETIIDVPQNVQDQKNIKIIALLIDNKTGEILNSCSSPVKSHSVNSISPNCKNTEKARNEWFNMNGQRVSSIPKKGIYIHNGKKVIR